MSELARSIAIVIGVTIIVAGVGGAYIGVAELQSSEKKCTTVQEDWGGQTTQCWEDPNTGGTLELAVSLVVMMSGGVITRHATR